MKTDGWQPGQRGQPETDGGPTESNVVRLPVDWLGPREELVPFGPGAPGREENGREEGGREEGGRERVESNVVELTPVSPSPAESFWDEDSATIQDALQGPSVAPALPSTDATAVHRDRVRVSAESASSAWPAPAWADWLASPTATATSSVQGCAGHPSRGSAWCRGCVCLGRARAS